MDFVPKIWTYFKGDPKQNKNKNLKHQNELQVDPFFDIMFPSIILRNIGLNDPFWNLSDGFSRNQYNHQNLQNKMPNNFNQSPNQSNLNSYNNYANFNNSQNNYQKPTQKNNKDNDKYQYFNYGANNKNSDDIYDL